MVGIPLSWLPPAWKGRGRIEHPVNWAQLPEFDVGVALLQQKTDYGHKNTWSVYIRKFNETDVVSMPVMAQSVVTSSAGSTQTITSDATFDAKANCIEAIGAGADGGIGAGTTTSGGGGGGGAYTRIIDMPCATPGTTSFFVRVGSHALPAGTVGDSWLTQTTPGTTYPVSAEVGLGAKGGAPLAAASTATGSAGGALASAYTNPATGSVAKSGGTGGASGASNAAGGAGGGAGGADASSATPGTGPTAGSPGNGGLNGGGTAGPAGNGAGAAAGAGTNINGTVGSGGGGGSGNAGPSTGGAGGLYGGGGGGGGRSNGVKGLGAQGIVVISWQLPVGKATDWAQPTPKTAAPGVELKTWAKPGGQLLLLGKDRIYRGAGQVPTYDWPNPRGPQFPTELRTWLQGGANNFYPPSTAYLPSQANFLNPWGPQRSISLYTWLSANTALISVTATVYEPAEAAYFNPWGAAYPVSLRTWTNAGIQAVADTANVPCQASFLNPWGAKPPASLYAWVVTPQLTAAAVPFSQPDWPVPRGVAYPVGLRTWVYEGTLNTAGPFSQLDWPNPVLRPRLELGTSNQVIRIDGATPLNQLDWPNPVLRTRLELGTVYQKTIAEGLKPFYQADWPNPLPRGRVDVTWISQGTTAGLLPPFYQTSWPNPIVRVRLELGWLSQVIPPSATANPFYQTDWVNPSRRISPEVTWLNQVISIDGLKPFLQLDWPNPNVRVRLELTWLNQGITTAAATPFSQSDWPNPALRIRLNAGWYNQVINFDGLKPIVPQVWVNPRGPTHPIALLTWLQSPAVSPPDTSNVPCSVTGWAVPWGPAYPVALRTWFNTVARRAPFNQLIWVNPPGPAYAVSLRTFLKLPIQEPLKPGLQSDWPVPRGAVGTIGLRTWINYRQNLNPGDTTNLPCIPGDWGAVPWGAVYPSALRTWVQSPPVPPPDQSNTPCAVSGWFPPWGPRRSIDLLTWINAGLTIDNIQTREATFFKYQPRSPAVSLLPAGNSFRPTETPPTPPDTTHVPSQASFFNPWGPKYPVVLRTCVNALNTVPSIGDFQIRQPTVFKYVPRSSAAAIGAMPGTNFTIKIPPVELMPSCASFFNPWGRDNFRALDSQPYQNSPFEVIGSYPCVPAAYFPPWGPQWAVQLRTWTNSWNTPFGPPTPPPKACYDYPNPRGPTFPISLRTHIDVPFARVDAFFGLAGNPNFDWPVPKGRPNPVRNLTCLEFTRQVVPPGPGNMTDWPNPRGATPANTLLTWINNTQQQLIGQDVLPLRQSDWPNPRGAARPVADFAQALTIAQTLTFPNKQTDWPNPRGAQRPVADFTQSVNLAVTTRPNRQTEWPVPRGAQRPASELQVAFGNTILIPPTPLSQTDWPNPRGAQPASTLNTWINQTQQQLIGKDALPFRQSEWPVPKSATPSISLRTDICLPFTRKDTFFGLAGNPNFNWPNPWGPRPLDIYTMLNGFSLPNAPPPPPDTGHHNLRFLADVGSMTSR